MSKTQQTDAEQTGNEPSRSLADRVDGQRLGKLLAGSIGGLVVNAALITAVIGSGLDGIAGGLVSLAPGVFIAAAVYDRYDPVDFPYVSPLILFLTILTANLITLMVRIFREGAQSDPVMSVLILGIVALMFTPGPFLGTWAVRRWWTDE